MTIDKAVGFFGLVAILAFGLCLGATQAWAQQSEPGPKVEFDELQEILLKARPAQANGLYYPAEEYEVPGRYTRTSLDLRTGELTVIPHDLAEASGLSVSAGQEPLPAWQLGGGPPMSPWLTEGITEGAESLDRDSRSCTPPPRSLATHDYPWKTTYKLYSRYHVAGIDYYSNCSASSFGSFHLLTAGHCIYSHDPNDDGDTSDAQWAQEVWVWAAQTDVVNPFGMPDRPFGFAKATVLDTYNEWWVDRNLNFDIGYVTLDRKVGDGTGWMGREANLTTTILNFNGYPTETPYVSPGELVQYPHSNPGNVTGYTTNRIKMCAYTYGGHSGGPVWRYDPGTGNRYVQGVNSTSTRLGYAEATRITSANLVDMDARIATDSIYSQPVPRPDLTEYVWSYADDTKDVSPNYVLQNQTFFVQYSLINAGFANSGPITVDFYLSDNNLISSYDTKVGTVNLGAIDGAWLYNVKDWPLVAGVAPGTYWVGWIMRCDVPEYGGDFTCTNDPCGNVVIVADETLTVLVNPDIFSDGFNFGNTSAWSSKVP